MKNKNGTPSAHPAGPDELIHKAADGDLLDFDIDVNEPVAPSKEERFRKFFAALINQGGVLKEEHIREIADPRSDETGFVAMVKVVEQFRAVCDTRAKLANRTRDLPDGLYLFSQNGGPEINVHGGDDAEKLNPAYIRFQFETSTDLEQVE